MAQQADGVFLHIARQGGRQTGVGPLPCRLVATSDMQRASGTSERLCPVMLTAHRTAGVGYLVNEGGWKLSPAAHASANAAAGSGIGAEPLRQF